MIPNLAKPVADKLQRLREDLAAMESLLVAFSGGVDSTLLARAAHDALGPRAAAVTVAGWFYPESEARAAGELAQRIGIRHLTRPANASLDAVFAVNPPDRCYHCKKTLFAEILQMAREQGFQHVADGQNRDDAGDYRPGARAAAELGVRSPLRDAGLSKADIRAIARALDLPNWNRPAMACLASRFPYGTAVTPDRARRVDAAETWLRDLGFDVVRVRYDGVAARIETTGEDVARLAQPPLRERVAAHLRALGFSFVALDLEGYRTGSLNRTLDPEP